MKDPEKEAQRAQHKIYIMFFRALANEERLEILQLLKKNGELCAQDVENHFYLEQSTTSHHLNTLRRAGITKIRKEGRRIFYSIDYDGFAQVYEQFPDLLK